MSREFLLFCCACCILVLTTINLSVGNVITGQTKDLGWGTLNCASIEDSYEDILDTLSDDAKKYSYDWEINECRNKKAVHDMEYTAFIFDIVIGFVCGLLGLLHVFGVNTGFLQKTGLIGFICGIIGFILTFVYVILNGIVFTNYNYLNYGDMVTGSSSERLYKRDSDGAYAEWDAGKNQYKCIYYDFDEPLNKFDLYAKFSDLVGKQYNYDKDYYFETNEEVKGCRHDHSCVTGTIPGSETDGNGNVCKKLYVPITNDIDNKDLFDRFLTTLLLSLIVCIAHIGLVIFGFLLLFKTQSGSPQSEPTKVVKVEN